MRGFTTLSAIIAAGVLAMGGAWALSAEPAAPPAAVEVEATPEPVSVTAVGNGQEVSDLSGPANSGYYFQFYIPAGTGRLTVATKDGDGDVDLYLAREYVPDTEKFQYVSNSEGTKDRIIVQNPQAGTWYALLYGYNKFGDVDLEVSWDKPEGVVYEQPVYVPGTVNYVTWGYGTDHVVWPVIIRPRPFLVTGLFFRHRPFFFRRHHFDHGRPIIINRGRPTLHRSLPPRPHVGRPGVRHPIVPGRVVPRAHVFGRGRLGTPRRGAAAGRLVPRSEPGRVPGRRGTGLRNPAIIRPGSPSARPRTPRLRTTNPSLRNPGVIRPGSPSARPATPRLRNPSILRAPTPRSRGTARPSRGSRGPGLRLNRSRGGPRGGVRPQAVRPGRSVRSRPQIRTSPSPSRSRGPALRSRSGARRAPRGTTSFRRGRSGGARGGRSRGGGRGRR